MVAQTFEDPTDLAGRRAALAAALEKVPSTRAGGQRSVLGAAPLSEIVGAGGGAEQVQESIPVLEPLTGLLPGGVRRGDAVSVQSRDGICDYLALALLAGALAAGLWCAVVGVPELGGPALADLVAGEGDVDRAAALDRLVVVPAPGEQWPEVVAALADGVDLVLVRPGIEVRAEVGRRVDARLRQGRSSGTRHSAALVVLGAWSSARLVLHTAATTWTGLDGVGPTRGCGRLTGGVSMLVAEGRATGGRRHSARMWLPAADGAARPIDDAAVAARGTEASGERALRVVA
ncbi:hypothetical protein KDK95_20835 [Actinospica sp. MGRD01-02]|uniref:Uncharacterized protein n=1 Tax=Actinospica acidithermotolerans TaxID=2828514 RepID=A0A941ECI0_9ACTN|nr:hypothetical protein [Actinospica acidithermotolerans]MBR7828767.1 hypothetical protein [Actinospica acidithermotolerans]